MAWAAVAAAAVGVVGGAVLSHSSGGGSSSSVSNQPSMSPEQSAALTQLITMLTGRSSSTTPYGGDLTAGMTPGQNMSLTALEQQALNPPDYSSAIDAFKAAIADNGTDISDSFTKGVEDPMIKDFQNKILPSITQRFGGNAAFGSDRQTAERNATGDLTSSLAGQRATMSFNAQEAAKTRGLQAATGLGNLQTGAQSAQMQALLQLFGAEAVPQQNQQAALTAKYGEFVRGQQGQDQNINQILAALGLNTVNTVVTPGTPGFLTSAAPGIGNAFTQWMMRNYFPQQQQTPTITSDPGMSGGSSDILGSSNAGP